MYKALLICNTGVFLSLLPNNAKAIAPSLVAPQLPRAHTTYPSCQTNYTTSNPTVLQLHQGEKKKRSHSKSISKQKKIGINISSGSESTTSVVDVSGLTRRVHDIPQHLS
jgi:hypothetical protein